VGGGGPSATSPSVDGLVVERRENRTLVASHRARSPLRPGVPCRGDGRRSVELAVASARAPEARTGATRSPLRRGPQPRSGSCRPTPRAVEEGRRLGEARADPATRHVCARRLRSRASTRKNAAKQMQLHVTQRVAASPYLVRERQVAHRCADPANCTASTRQASAPGTDELDRLTREGFAPSSAVAARRRRSALAPQSREEMEGRERGPRWPDLEVDDAVPTCR